MSGPGLFMKVIPYKYEITTNMYQISNVTSEVFSNIYII